MSRKKTNKIEAETGEVVQSNKPFIIRNGGIAKPLGQGLYLLGGKTHEQGGIDIDFTGDARIFSAQPILNGNSPAELVARGANPNQTFNRQERFKDVNGINDDGSRKARYGKLQKKFAKSTEENPISATDFNKSLYRYGEENIKKIDPNSLSRTDINGDIDIIDKDNYFYTIASDINGDPVRIYDLNDSNELPLGYSKNKNDKIKQSLINARKQLDYIGTGDDEMARFFGKTKSIVNAVDSLSNVYGINRDVFLERLSHEGLIDDLINVYNYGSNKEQQKNISNYSLNNTVLAFDQLGLDRAGEHLTKGHYNMRWKDKNRGYWDEHHTNEDGVVVHSVGVPNLASGLEIKAAHIEYLTNLMKKKHPNSSKKELDTLVNAAYNLGENHKDLNDREWINKNYEVLPWSEMINKSMNNSNKKQLGGSTGIIRVQANGQDRLMYIPSTGEETKADRKKALFGLKTHDEEGNLTKWGKNKNSIIEGGVSLLGNAGAGLASYFINRSMLKDLKNPEQPIAQRASKLKTTININPELDTQREALAQYRNDVAANTADSRVSLARMNTAGIANAMNINRLYTDKENRETALINQDRLNQQEIANANIDAYNAWNQNKVSFENAVREKQSENAIGLVNNLNAGIQNTITGIQNKRNFRNNLAAIALANPNVRPEMINEMLKSMESLKLYRCGGRLSKKFKIK